MTFPTFRRPPRHARDGGRTMTLWPGLVVLCILLAPLPALVRIARRVPVSNDDFVHL